MKSKKIMFGKDCIRGTRIPYATINNLIKVNYPTLTLDLIISSKIKDRDELNRYLYIENSSTIFNWRIQ